MTPEAFIEKWEQVTTTERAAAHTHFLDLCELLEVDKPLDVDRKGEFYAFERRVSKVFGGDGFADVWRRGHFAWEYKRKKRNLSEAYRQLILYRDDLENPPLLVVCDLERFEVHTNFTGTPKQVHTFTIHDLIKPDIRALLKNVFTDPETLNPKLHRERVTKDASEQIARLAVSLQSRGHDPETVAHFLMQVVFALFAEDVGLLPNKLMTRILERTHAKPERAQRYLSELFQAMALGGEVLLEDVPYFNGGLFDDRGALPLEQTELETLLSAAKLDWAEVEPVIFGTLFERSLDPEKRSQLGAHYTSREDILRIVQPVVIDPLRARWAELRTKLEAALEKDPRPELSVLERGDKAKYAQLTAWQRRQDKAVKEPVVRFVETLRQVKVLDPACGSGNFLYVAFQQLKELERDVLAYAQTVGVAQAPFVSPRQFYGLELNVFAHELASIVVWIGFLQWNYLNQVSDRQRPILERLDTIKLQDALLDGDTETVWPEADFIVGNPPFLGDRKMRRELGHDYVEKLRRLFEGRIPGSSDFVCYWFEKARAQIVEGKTKRAGLIATNSVATGENSKVLTAIKQTGDIFMAWSDEPWILEGAAVRVSLVGFDNGQEQQKTLNGQPVAAITPFLKQGTDVSVARRLPANEKQSFIGVQKGGDFDISDATAQSWFDLPNPDGVSNRDVLKPYINGMDIARQPRDMWVIDFFQMSEAEAEAYIIPFEHVKTRVKPERDLARRDNHRIYWWRHHDTRPAMREMFKNLNRYICSSIVAKHRVWVFQPVSVLPDKALVVIAADDFYTFGVLHSSLHELWALAIGTRLENRPRYTPSTCFETFPFPRPTDAQHAEIEKWAKYLDAVRAQLLQADPSRTMTKLYNNLTSLRETRDSTHPVYALLVAHDKLDAAVATAYGWEWPLSDEVILERLLALNLERASQQGAAPTVTAEVAVSAVE